MPVTAPAGAPFKFLNPYGLGDQRFFFGRDRETRTLLADVLVSRLVVLFARTGTGKTSLINAGIQPRLEDLGFRTVYVRVSKDPTSSAREALAEIDWIGRLPRKRLSEQLAWRTLRRRGWGLGAGGSRLTATILFLHAFPLDGRCGAGRSRC